jgi:organic hydroperoxide reductase OsmC/OhrA
MSETPPVVHATLEHEDGYRFIVRFDDPSIRDLHTDEPPPLGEGTGPNPTRLLASAIASCLASSLRFCLEKARIPTQDLVADVELRTVRNAANRLRVGDVTVRLAPAVTRDDAARMRRCLDIFESFCIVTESVREGFPVHVEVTPRVANKEAVAGGAIASHEGEEAPVPA